MREIRSLLAPAADPGLSPRRTAEVRLRPPQIGDLAWVAHRHAVLYHREYGFDGTFEGLVCEIVGRIAG